MSAERLGLVANFRSTLDMPTLITGRVTRRKDAKDLCISGEKARCRVGNRCHGSAGHRLVEMTRPERFDRRRGSVV
jgi:hypothetical protein